MYQYELTMAYLSWHNVQPDHMDNAPKIMINKTILVQLSDTAFDSRISWTFAHHGCVNTLYCKPTVWSGKPTTNNLP